MNKSLISLFLLSLLVIAWLKPSIPFIYYELNKFYIQKYLCEQKDKPNNACNGKCHLRKQIKKVNEQETNREFPLPPKASFDDHPVFDIVNLQDGFLDVWIRKSCLATFKFYNYYFSRSVFHPPKTALSYQV